jgi:AraC family transcriptional regulator
LPSLDPGTLTVDPEPELSAIDLTPRLFFYDAALWSTAQKLIALVETPRSESRLYAEALSTVLAVELARLERGLSVRPAATRGGLAAWQARAACEYIETHLAEDVALADLAAVAKLSPAHFCRALKQSLSVPPHQYQVQRRIDLAKTLLADPQWPVLEIALNCGSSFSSNLTKAFRKATGITPREFRRTLQ